MVLDFRRQRGEIAPLQTAPAVKVRLRRSSQTSHTLSEYQMSHKLFKQFLFMGHPIFKLVRVVHRQIVKEERNSVCDYTLCAFL